MNQAVVEFLKKVAEDEGLQARLQAAADLDEAYAIASDVQGGFTKEEFAEDMEKIRNAVAGDDELGEDDLKTLAGGYDTVNFVVSTVIGTGMGAGLIAGVASVL